MTAVWHADRAIPPKTGPTVGDLFSYGFRPFFLGAAVYAVVLMVLWLAFIVATQAGGDGAWLPIAGSPYAWHAHEFAMGFIAAAIAGFLLTAVPNWTGALPLKGTALAGLFALWLAGRFVMVFSGLLPPVLVATADIAFVPVLAAFATRQLLVKPAPHNFVLIAILLIITCANALYHLGSYGVLSVEPLAAVRSIVLAVTVIIAVIGGRIIPAFTHNWLNVRRHKGPMPYRDPKLDAASVLSIAIFTAAEIWHPGSLASGVLAAIAACINGLRLFGWRGWQTRSEPIVWILHLGYAWLVAGLAISALAAMTGTIPTSLAYHALGAGAAATMILAVMSRAALGHTGRKLIAPPLVVWCYRLITLAALLRVFGAMLATSPAASGLVLSVAAIAWIAAFSLFTFVYAPILAGPRVQEKLS